MADETPTPKQLSDAISKCLMEAIRVRGISAVGDISVMISALVQLQELAQPRIRPLGLDSGVALTDEVNHGR